MIMAFDKQKLFERLKKIADEKKPLFLDELFTLAGLSSETFYRLFPKGSGEYDAIQNKILDNRAHIRAALRRRWFNSEHPHLQKSLYALIASDDELRRLFFQRTVIETGKQANIEIVINPLDNGREKKD